jgi:hypothetical protein
MEETPHLMIELVWEDFDLEELSISATNGQFSGTATVYFAHGDIQVLADSIRGFPKTISQRETFSGGNETHPPFAELVFYCTDGTGHPAVRVALTEPVYHAGLRPSQNHVELELPFEPIALDDFCRQLDLVAGRRTKRAVLRGLPA